MSQPLRQLTEHVWLFPRDPDLAKVRPNIGIICTPTQTVIIDAGNGPQHARDIQAALQTIQAPPVSYVIYTHHHWDHIFGAQVFAAPTIAHQECTVLLERIMENPWNKQYLQEQLQDDPQGEMRFRAVINAVDDWDTFQVILPDHTFTEHMTLQLDGLTIELEHVGGIHAADSIVAYIPEAQIMFVGDCFYPPPFEDGPLNIDMLRAMLEKREIEFFVDGHSSRPLSRRMLLR